MARERTFRTEAIVLRRSDFGEADRLLTLFSRDYGKIRAIAKGARKPQSRKTGHVELFMRSRFFLAEGRDLHVITQAELVEAYAALREDLVRTTYASYACELLDRFTTEDDRHVDMYDLLAEVLDWFATIDDVMLAARTYELRLLSMAGFRPQLFECLACREPIQEQDQFFSAELGGLLCPNCQAEDGRAVPITAVAVKVLRYLQTRPWEVVKVLQLKRPLHRELEALLHHYITYLLERDLKAVDFLHRLRREANLFAPPEE
ncbi:MAG: DNA repair protein RecO [Ardenticatenaceae bacterium]|nr:DNA repair protein RecO [Anaerolineales bacterium]MCB8920765.1 DNA repair protein RecO [Ardenticatenaceae bacterium]MCB8989724.1 DNA repair protein RecO [Ardenticatenaceae bacterium]MCB9002817.1 DNA repair protein RecO [Ardenticatenaceae bacterium]